MWNMLTRLRRARFVRPMQLSPQSHHPHTTYHEPGGDPERARSLFQWATIITCVLVTVVILSDRFGNLHFGPRQPKSQKHVYFYEGSLNDSSALFVHLLTAVDLLIRVTPIEGDVDLIVSTGENYKTLLKHTPKADRSRCLPSTPVYRFTASWDALLTTGESDVYQLFTQHSTSLGTEEIIVRQERHQDLKLLLPRPLMIVVYTYPCSLENYRFRLEVFPHKSREGRFDDIHHQVNKNTLTFDELTLRYATIPKDYDSAEGNMDYSTPQILNTWSERLGHFAKSFEPLLTAMADILVDLLL